MGQQYGNLDVLQLCKDLMCAPEALDGYIFKDDGIWLAEPASKTVNDLKEIGTHKDHSKPILRFPCTGGQLVEYLINSKQVCVLEKAASRLYLNQRAEVEDVIKQALNLNNDNPRLKLSFFYESTIKVIDFSTKEVSAEAGLFEIGFEIRTPMDFILDKEKRVISPKDVWPDDDGYYPLNSYEDQGLYIMLTKNGHQYFIPGSWGKKFLQKSDLFVTMKNLNQCALERGKPLRPDRGTTAGGREMIAKPFTVLDAAASIGTNSAAIMKLILSPTEIDERIYPWVYLRDVLVSNFHGEEGNSQLLTGWVEVEGIEGAPPNSMGEFILSYGGRFRIFLHKGADTFFLKEEVFVKESHLFISADDVSRMKAKRNKACPPMELKLPFIGDSEVIPLRLIPYVTKPVITSQIVLEHLYNPRGDYHPQLCARNVDSPTVIIESIRWERMYQSEEEEQFPAGSFVRKEDFEKYDQIKVGEYGDVVRLCLSYVIADNDLRVAFEGFEDLQPFSKQVLGGMDTNDLANEEGPERVQGVIVAAQARPIQAPTKEPISEAEYISPEADPNAMAAGKEAVYPITTTERPKLRKTSTTTVSNKQLSLPPSAKGRRGVLQKVILDGLDDYYVIKGNWPPQGSAFQSFLIFLYNRFNAKPRPSYMDGVLAIRNVEHDNEDCMSWKIKGEAVWQKRKYIEKQFGVFKSQKYNYP